MYKRYSLNFQLDDYITDLSVAVQELIYNQDPNTHFNAFLNKFLDFHQQIFTNEKTLESKTTNLSLG